MRIFLQSSKIALDEALDEYEGMAEAEIRKEIEAKDMAAQAQILEMVSYQKLLQRNTS